MERSGRIKEGEVSHNTVKHDHHIPYIEEELIDHPPQNDSHQHTLEAIPFHSFLLFEE